MASALESAGGSSGNLAAVEAGPKSLSELAAQRRRTIPPPLPKRSPKIVPPPVQAPPIDSGAVESPPVQAVTVLSPAAASQTQSSSRWGRFTNSLPSCWASLVLHLAFVLVLASIAVPTPLRRMLLPLVAMLTESSEGEAIQTTSLDPTVDLATGPELGDQPALLEGFGSAPPLADVTAPQTLANLLQEPPSAPDLSLAPKPAADPGVQTQTARGSPLAAAPPRREVFTSATGPNPDDLLAPAAARERQYDHAVEQFIRFDLGRLPGEEGAGAQRAFNSLGSEALPAMIRGLNRSAQISGSCPVIVLAGRVEQLLRQSQDPASLRYALVNIGRDVPRSATHHRHIAALRMRLFGGDVIAEQLKSQGLPVTARMRERGASILQLPPARLLSILKSKDNEAKILALAAIQVGQTELAADLRLQIVQATIGLLDEEGMIQRQARSALVALGGGVDHGPEPGATEFDIKAATEAWTRHWRAQGLKDEEDQAQALLDRGIAMDERGSSKPAMQRYREVVARYPHTQAAEEAQKRLGLFAGP